MKVALFSIHNMFACHYALFGYRETLERMGHEVLEFQFPQNQVMVTPQLKAAVPTIDALLGCEVILSTYHEYVQPWLKEVYSFASWKTLMEKRPVLARFDESMDRTDLGLPMRVPELLQWATHYSWPAAQDAKQYGGEWLPYGADTTIFKPFPDTADFTVESNGFVPKKIELGFIGSMYPIRQQYLQKLVQHIAGPRRFYIGQVAIQDIEGIHERDTTDRLAMNYRNIKIFFCLPPASKLVVEKVVDVMACNTMVMYPRLYDAAAENQSIFKDNENIVFYEFGHFAENGKQVMHFLDHPEEVDRIAAAGGELIRSKHTLRGMLQKMLDQAVPF